MKKVGNRIRGENDIKFDVLIYCAINYKNNFIRIFADLNIGIRIDCFHKLLEFHEEIYA